MTNTIKDNDIFTVLYHLIDLSSSVKQNDVSELVSYHNTYCDIHQYPDDRIDFLPKKFSVVRDNFLIDYHIKLAKDIIEFPGKYNVKFERELD